MKFQIVTFNQATHRPGYPQTDAKPYAAMTGPIPGTLGDPFRTQGRTREEAKAGLLLLLQHHIDTYYPEFEMTEVDLQPKQLDQSESP